MAILDVVRAGSTRTAVIFRAAINAGQASRHLLSLTNEGLVRDEGGSFYRITEAGMTYLRKSSEISELVAMRTVKGTAHGSRPPGKSGSAQAAA